jgi:hypothetical protein
VLFDFRLAFGLTLSCFVLTRLPASIADLDD